MKLLEDLQRAASWHLLAAGLVAMTFLCDASAMSLREMRALEKSGKQGTNYVNYYLVGAVEGALHMHAQDVRNGTAPTICLGERRLEPQMVRSLFDTELKRNAGTYEADMPVQLVLMNALTTVYAC